jgi:hypothetical protein
MDSEAITYINALITAVNAYAVAMEMAAWSQATATTNAGNLATALTAATNAYNAATGQEGRIP